MLTELVHFLLAFFGGMIVMGLLIFLIVKFDKIKILNNGCVYTLEKFEQGKSMADQSTVRMVYTDRVKAAEMMDFMDDERKKSGESGFWGLRTHHIK